MDENPTPTLIDALQDPAAYDHAVTEPVELIETHISWVLLAGPYAYKIKKPVSNSFLDYSTLSLRQHYCAEELRLNRRFSRDLYLDVVPICESAGQPRFGITGKPIEFAVRMKRFPNQDLLTHRLAGGLVSTSDVRELAARVASFHAQAAHAAESSHCG